MCIYSARASHSFPRAEVLSFTNVPNRVKESEVMLHLVADSIPEF